MVSRMRWHAAAARIPVVKCQSHLHDAQPAMNRLRPLRQQIEKLQSSLQKPGPLVLHRNEQTQRLYQVRRKAKQPGAFVERLLNQRKLAKFEVAKPAMNQP